MFFISVIIRQNQAVEQAVPTQGAKRLGISGLSIFPLFLLHHYGGHFNILIWFFC